MVSQTHLLCTLLSYFIFIILELPINGEKIDASFFVFSCFVIDAIFKKTFIMFSSFF
jgi:hypothetical protein